MAGCRVRAQRVFPIVPVTLGRCWSDASTVWGPLSIWNAAGNGMHREVSPVPCPVASTLGESLRPLLTATCTHFTYSYGKLGYLVQGYRRKNTLRWEQCLGQVDGGGRQLETFSRRQWGPLKSFGRTVL